MHANTQLRKFQGNTILSNEEIRSNLSTMAILILKE